MTITCSRSREDVLRWPDDPAARRRLEDYFDYLGKLPADSRPAASLLDGRGLDFTGSDLPGLDLLEAELSEANLSGVRLVGADLSGAWLIGAVLRGADLSQCNLRKAQGRACDAQDVILRGAGLQRSEFEAADLRRADLREARFGSASFSMAPTFSAGSPAAKHRWRKSGSLLNRTGRAGRSHPGNSRSGRSLLPCAQVSSDGCASGPGSASMHGVSRRCSSVGRAAAL
jgi:Pentapeptide repeats (8 copies)